MYLWWVLIQCSFISLVQNVFIICFILIIGINLTYSLLVKKIQH